MSALRTKSLALTDLFIRLVEERCAGHGLSLVTPRDHAQRGSQVCLSRKNPEDPQGGSGAYAIVQALIARGVIGDFRAPDLMRFGFAPLYNRFSEVVRAAEILEQILASREWDQPRFKQRAKVT
jgi:kynureninase